MFFADLSLAFLLIAYPLAVGIPLYSRARVRDLQMGPFSNSTSTSRGQTTSGAQETEVHLSSASSAPTETRIESQPPLAPPVPTKATETEQPQITPSASPIETSLPPVSASSTYSKTDNENENLLPTHVLPSRESNTFAASPSGLSEDDATSALPYKETATVSAYFDTSNGIGSPSKEHLVGLDTLTEALPEGSRLSDGIFELQKSSTASETALPDQPQLPSTNLKVTSEIEMLSAPDPTPDPVGPGVSSEDDVEFTVDTLESTGFEWLSSSVGTAEGAIQTDRLCPQGTQYCTTFLHSGAFTSAAESSPEDQARPSSFTKAMGPVQNLGLANDELQTEFSQETPLTGASPTKHVVYHMTVERQTMGSSLSPAGVSRQSASASSADIANSVVDSFVSTKGVDAVKTSSGHASSQGKTGSPSSRIDSTSPHPSSREEGPETSSPLHSTLPVPTKGSDSTEQGENQAKSSSEANQSESPEYDALAPSRSEALSPRQQGTTAGIIIASAGAASAVGICIFLGARKFRSNHGGALKKVSTSRSATSSMDIQCAGLEASHAPGLSIPYRKIS